MSSSHHPHLRPDDGLVLQGQGGPVRSTPQQSPLPHQAFHRFVNDLTMGRCDAPSHALRPPLPVLPNQLPTLNVCLVSPLLGLPPPLSHSQTPLPILTLFCFPRSDSGCLPPHYLPSHPASAPAFTPSSSSLTACQLPSVLPHPTKYIPTSLEPSPRE